MAPTSNVASVAAMHLRLRWQWRRHWLYYSRGRYRTGPQWRVAYRLAGLVSIINPLSGTNYPTWKEVLVVLEVTDYNHILHKDKPVAHAANAYVDALRTYNTKQ